MRDVEQMLWREKIANKPKHWVRAVTACNSRCIFCLDSDTPRGVYLDEEEVRREIDRGLEELGAEKIIISGGEASLHPKFVDLVRYAKERGYDRVQTVTNGYRFAEKDFFEACMAAGLGEITFSLHGHTPELHDRLTQTEGAFKRLVKGMVRALRDGRPIVNVDVVINKQNVAVIDRIVELCISLGVTEFDLLHVIPQAAAFDHRDELFYDVREHLPRLQQVFRLNRHERIVVWTNRFPVSYLEGLEDLIQDPHKMLDEVNGRRFQVRRYLDEGKPLDCRDPERCPHCFIEPFCTTMDRVVEGQNQASFEVWSVGAQGSWEGELPFGATLLGLERPTGDELPIDRAIYARIGDAAPLPTLFRGSVVVAASAEQLDAWMASLPAGITLEVRLNRATAAWLLEHRERVAALGDSIWLHQPSHEHMHTAHEEDVRDPRRFFEALDLPLRVSGLPACLLGPAQWIPERRILEAALFDDTGRLDIQALARHHVRAAYRGKSVRCGDCRLDAVCEGIPINMVRDQGLAMLAPLDDTAEIGAPLSTLLARGLSRLAGGRPPEPVAPSLPGHAPPRAAPPDPLAVIERERLLKKTRRRGLPMG
jgi:MoaA/NifB/PqqE/SkfB family radical SAM enzyme